MPRIRPGAARFILAAAVFASAPALPAAAGDAGDDGLTEGRVLFVEQAEPPCGVCHMLADAGTEGEVGPDLDELQPTEDQVLRAVSNGIEAMPPYKDTLSEAEIATLAAYVATVAGRD